MQLRRATSITKQGTGWPEPRSHDSFRDGLDERCGRAAQGVRIAQADAYLAARTGTYEQRCVRYDAALRVMFLNGIDDRATVIDVGSGWGEFGHRMAIGYGRRARYIPVDACIDGCDLNTWNPPRRAEWFVALEIVEHLTDPVRLIRAVQEAATRGLIVSTPNPATTDVLAMCADHRTPVPSDALRAMGFNVSTHSFYGNPDDALLGVWLAA